MALWLLLGVLTVIIGLILLLLRAAGKGAGAVARRAEHKDTARRAAAHRRVVGQFDTQIGGIPVFTDARVAASETPGGAGRSPDPSRSAGPHRSASATPRPAYGWPTVEHDAPPASPRGRAETSGRHHRDSALGRRPAPLPLAAPVSPAWHAQRRKAG